MFNKKMQYVIKSVPTDDKQALEDLLNQMSEEGWDLIFFILSFWFDIFN